jgi:SAM-dependent methyltransferase
MSWRYDNIPEEVILPAQRILDVGIGDDDVQLQSKYASIFRSHRYCGVDIRKIKLPRKCDLVLALEFIEHIPYYSWKRLFEKFKSLVAPDGTLIISTPYGQSRDGYIPPTNEEQRHVEFSIYPDLIRSFLPSATIRIIAKSTFRENNESFLWACGRYLKRVITRHKYIVHGVIPKKTYCIFAIWRKK